MTTFQTSNLGYPRIGENREWKKTLEAFWASKLKEEQFLAIMKDLRLNHLKKQKEKGIALIPVGDFTHYDHVLDTATMFGLVPQRFEYSGGIVPLSTYFSMARGSKNAQACTMTKWFDTNYHYIVPEIENKTPILTENRPLKAYIEAKEEAGIDGKPVILGPFTFLKLSKGYDLKDFQPLLNTFIPLYVQVLQELHDAGARLIQVDEPSLVTTITAEEMALFRSVYETIHKQAPDVSILLQTYFDSINFYQDVIQLPVKGIGLDFVHGQKKNLEALKQYGFPKDKLLGVGIVDGRNIWKSDLTILLQKLDELSAVVPYDRQIIQPSSSLLHVPVTVKHEQKLEPILKEALAFCDEKLNELNVLKQAITEPSSETKQVLAANKRSIENIANSQWRKQADEKLITSARTKRPLPFGERQVLQEKKWNLPLLPTTTIGSFPQTQEVRLARNLWRKGELAEAEYEQLIKEKIEKWVQIQEEIGLDVLVHGEFERNDMVEFFGEKLAGFAFTKNGWVQSYGSRCVKPPIIFGDVTFIKPMTVTETVYAQSLTKKPVKGMLTGPVTILNWSFARNDLSLKEVAFQIARALIKEIDALESVGIEMIQVDEPALREGLPLKENKWDEYLSWAVEAFRIATSQVKNTTQIHTHMCYSEFNQIIDAIKALDADVISIETSRSHGELIYAFESNIYDKGIGLGVYDIHSPRVPSEEEMDKVIRRALAVLPEELFWVNPDCGLKTRGEAETIAALKNMVSAAQNVRSSLIEKKLTTK